MAAVRRDRILPYLLRHDDPDLTDEILTHPLPSGLVLAYGVFVPLADGWLGLTPDLLAELELQPDALHALSLANLDRLDVQVEDHGEFFSVTAPDVPASSLALRPGLWADRVLDDASSRPLVWVAAPDLLLCARRDTPEARTALAIGAMMLLQDGHIEQLASREPWIAGDPPEPLGTIRLALPPEHGLPEQPAALHLGLAAVATLGQVVGSLVAWRALVASGIGDHGVGTTLLAGLPFLVPGVVYASADRIRHPLVRGIAKLAAWTGMTVYAGVALVLHALSAQPVGPLTWLTTALATLASAWYVATYAAWLLRRG